MTISFYLVLGIAIIAVLLLVKFFGEKNGINRKTNVLRWGFMIVLSVLGLLSMMTVRKYMYPKDTEIFANSDYHLLEHRGFRVKDTFDLVKNKYPHAYAPEESLWDAKSGSVTLTRDKIFLSEYHEPFFVSKKEGKKDYKFVLSNRPNQFDASKGFELTRDGKTIYRMEITSFDEDSCRYETIVKIGDQEKRYPSSFKKVIRKGYPLCDIIAATPEYTFTEELYEILQGTLLVREKIVIDNLRYAGESGSSDVGSYDLVVMPGQAWYYDYNEVLLSGNNVVDMTEFEVPLDTTYRTMFYSGIGRTKTDVYKLSYSEGQLELRYALPKMQHFSKDHSRVFLTSSVAAVMDDPKEGGYYYNIFDLDENLYHINAEMRYQVGNSTEELAIEVMDMYSDNPSDKIAVDAKSEFHLATHSADVDWIFGVRDLRAENSLGWGYISFILLLFISLVMIRISLDYFLQTKSLSYIELSIYVVLLCMATVRLIISWRVSTFVPIEDISGPMFGTMLNGKSGWTWAVCLYPAVLIICTLFRGVAFLSAVLNKVTEWFKNVSDGLEIKCQSSRCVDFFLGPKTRIVTVFVLGLVFCFVGSKVSALNRLLNIPGPLVLYILCDLWLVYKERKMTASLSLWRAAISLLLAGYLFKADAGFIVIFFVYLILLHCIIGPLTEGSSRYRGWKYLKYGYCLFSLLFIFVVLKYEGEIMIWLFENISWMSKIIYALGVSSFAIFVSYRLVHDVDKISSVRKNRIITYAVSATVAVVALCFTIVVGNKLAELVEGKAHMKWRAEVQKLDEEQNETIDDLIQKCDFNSSDITFIMRSAHNQWFINQYFKEGDRDSDKRYFQLQPHSNQGSTFTTQTTDLAITRYVTAEHGHWPPRWMLVLFLLLIAIYCFEIRFNDEDGKEDRVLLGALVLLFTLALLVYLSATNRIVFIGQDFPFMSIQSKVAVIFPVILLLLATFPVMIDRMNDERGADSPAIINQKRLIPFYLLGLYLLTVSAIAPLGKDQDETQFDVSAIIQDISSKVALIDRDFERYQRVNEMIDAPKEDVWMGFKEEEKFSKNLHSAMASDSVKFFASLLTYFDTEQVEKDNPEELLHMRKRNGIWHLAVNKKHFFIPSKKSVAEMWKGNVYAARVHREFKFEDVKGDAAKENYIDSTETYEPNILPKNIRDKVENVKVIKFDKTWTPYDEPLILVTSKQAKSSRQFYNIESPSGSIRGGVGKNQVATRVMRGDVLVLNVLDSQKEVEEVVSWKYGMESDRYLAKNIWMNGRNRLFYPMGKDFIWSYQFANMVSSVYSKDEQYRDSSIRLSLDYELHKKFNDLLDNSNKTKVRSLKQNTLDELLSFAQKPLSKMADKNNKTSFYYDKLTAEVKYKKRLTADVDAVLKRINRTIKSKVAKNSDARNDQLVVSDAVYEATERMFEFTAVAIDGDGKIRLMYDHGKTRVVDPNDISHFNQFVSELYKSGDNSSERDVFGNKTLQILPSGPGSTFKPIMYTAITSNQKIAWESIDVSTDYQDAAKHVKTDKESQSTDATMYDYYGGVDLAKAGEKPLTIDSYGKLLHNNYLIYSDNLYHSVMVLLGMQPQGRQLDVMKPSGTGKYAFPVFTYNGKRMSFDPDKWFPDGNLDVESGILNVGLSDNFNLMELMTDADIRYSNYFGNYGQFEHLFEEAGSYKTWVFAETGSQNVPDRSLKPYIRSGFNQLLLGASPLEVSPLQMGTMVMRLATLNKSANITTLMDDPSFKPNYEFFDNYGWNSDDEFFSFYKRQVLSQLRQVPVYGTARALKTSATNWAKNGYYVYAKTGTLNDGRDGQSRNSRMKHLIVIISNTPLEEVEKVEDLKDVKYYAMYMSYIGIDRDYFSNTNGNAKFIPMIQAVMDSELFKQYMGE